jgi:hypothetical protein
MDDTQTNAEAATVDADALKAAQAGYNRRAGVRTTPAQAAAPVEPAQPLADQAPSPAPAAPAPAVEVDDEQGLEAEPEKSDPPAKEAISAQLDDLKAQIRELKASGVDASTVHRLFGEIGGITRVVKQLQAKAAPSESELAGAIKAAEKTAEEYPEIGGPMVAALKALAAQIPQKTEPAEPEPSAAPAPTTTQAPVAAPPADPYTPDQRAAIKFLDDLHPDRLTVTKTPEFKSWLSAKPADYQKRFTTSWDFAFIAKGYDEYKAAQQAKRKKAERLEAAVTPQGTAAAPQPTTTTPEAQARVGYERYRSKRIT